MQILCTFNLHTAACTSMQCSQFQAACTSMQCSNACKCSVHLISSSKLDIPACSAAMHANGVTFNLHKVPVPSCMYQHAVQQCMQMLCTFNLHACTSMQSSNACCTFNLHKIPVPSCMYQHAEQQCMRMLCTFNLQARYTSMQCSNACKCCCCL